MCVRGLKPSAGAQGLAQIMVARRVRAWIETETDASLVIGATVARRVRAWIETVSSLWIDVANKSHAVCVRGLKLMKPLKNFLVRLVARRVRAWIETGI